MARVFATSSWVGLGVPRPEQLSRLWVRQMSRHSSRTSIPRSSPGESPALICPNTGSTTTSPPVEVGARLVRFSASSQRVPTGRGGGYSSQEVGLLLGSGYRPEVSAETFRQAAELGLGLGEQGKKAGGVAWLGARAGHDLGVPHPATWAL